MSPEPTVLDSAARVGLHARAGTGEARCSAARCRVLWLSHLLPWPPQGGVTQRSFNLMKQIARRHELHVVAFRQRAHQAAPSVQEEAVRALEEFATVHAVHDLPEDEMRRGRLRLVLRSLAGAPYTVLWGRCPAYARSICQVLDSVAIDVVHFDTLSLAQYAPCCGGLPKLLNHHNIESEMLRRRAARTRNPVLRAYFALEGRRLARYEAKVQSDFDRHLVCSALDGERFRGGTGAQAIEIVPNGVDLQAFCVAPPDQVPEPESLVFVGGLGWYPNRSAIEFFLREVWPSLGKRFPGAHFSVVGRNPPLELTQLVEADPRVRFHGFVEDIHPLVHGASVYVCPIFDGGGTKLKMLDAMAMGKAIVAHPVACEGLDLVDGEQVLVAETPSDFLSAIERVFRDESLRRSLERAARNHVQDRFDFERIGAGLSRILEECVVDPHVASHREEWSR